MPRRLAIFDFDDTLVQGDSLWPFLWHVAGARLLPALFGAGARLLWARLCGAQVETRGFVKAHLLLRALAGKKRGEAAQAAARLRRDWLRHNEPVAAALRAHHAQGDKILVASGGLDLYLPELLRDIPYDALLCTAIGTEGEALTGVMINGNCVRAEKAEQVAAWIAQNGPFDEIWAYGNYPHDVPMMMHATHRIIV